MLRNTPSHWGSLSKTLHWTVVFLILLEVPVGFLMSYTYGGKSFGSDKGLALHRLFEQIHHTNGFVILTLALVRIVLRLTGAAPKPVTVGWQDWLSRIVHFAILFLLVLLPMSGWAALSVFRGAPIWLFDNQNIIPWILPKHPSGDPYGYGLYAKIHVWSYKIGAGLLTLHIGAALWHHFFRKDTVLLRMWPLAKGENRPLPDLVSAISRV
jgi:cytochrome b561